ncbi:MAG: hypothetical protein H6R10_2369 [Rhodocyclaceae bacterium]|nr:hypothetical protein [Rhodocyclaceae bacterium]
MNRSLNRAGLSAAAGALGFSLFLLGVTAFVPAASAAETVAASPASGKRFASVWRIRGDVVASGSGGAERPLRQGDAVFVGERVHAASTAEAVLKTEDAGIVAVRPGSDFVAESFAAEGKNTDNFTVRILNGSLRIITGWIGKLNRGGHQVVTPQATIGIRGTDHEPYVLSAEMARATSNKPGTYDKVNRGGTTLDANGNKLDIDSGRVGFAPTVFKQRALMTLLLPVLLDKVPNFYVPGEFDAELDKYSQTADEESQRELEQKRKAAEACVPADIAKKWLGQLDGAIVRGDAPAVMALFAPDVAVRATVRDKEGVMTTLELGREELAQSTIAAVKGLTNYKQRRISTDAKPAEPGSCDRIAVKSVVIEQGRQAGKPYRFESVEDYLLESRAGDWLAVKAETTQR